MRDHHPPSAAPSLAGMDVVILAGGLGTRIRSVLGDTPKLLAPVGGRPLLDLLAAHLAGCGADRIVLALGWGAEMVADYLPRLAQKPIFAGPGRHCPDIIPIAEPVQAGTAGAVRHVRQHLRPGPAIVMNGDTLTDADVAALAARQAASGADAALLCVAVADTGRFGCIELTDDNRIARFAEKAPAAGPGLISAGIYALSAGLLDRIAASQATSLESDFFQQAPPGALAALVSGGRFVDVGTPDGFAEAQTLFGA